MKQKIRSTRFRAYGSDLRRGFALPFILLLLMVLVTFLMAAQGTVLSSAKMVKRSAVRADEQAAVTAAISHVKGLTPAAIGASGQSDVALPSELGEAVKCTAGVLAAGDSLYVRQPGVSHRAGDVLVRISSSQSGSEEAQEFLINTSGSRVGIIGL